MVKLINYSFQYYKESKQALCNLFSLHPFSIYIMLIICSYLSGILTHSNVSSFTHGSTLPSHETFFIKKVWFWPTLQQTHVVKKQMSTLPDYF